MFSPQIKSKVDGAVEQEKAGGDSIAGWRQRPGKEKEAQPEQVSEDEGSANKAGEEFFGGKVNQQEDSE